MLIAANVQKASDSTSHEKHIKKFEAYSLPTKIIRSFLKGRTQFVELERRKSTKKDPLLFLIYINNFSKFTTVHTMFC